MHRLDDTPIEAGTGWVSKTGRRYPRPVVFPKLEVDLEIGRQFVIYPTAKHARRVSAAHFRSFYRPATEAELEEARKVVPQRRVLVRISGDFMLEVSPALAEPEIATIARHEAEKRGLTKILTDIDFSMLTTAKTIVRMEEEAKSE